MTQLAKFLDPTFPSLKICGVTTQGDAEDLIELGVDAVGFNFWPKSKRYLSTGAALWMRNLAGKILRVGVFVNEAPELPIRLFHQGYLDVVQLHGDESPLDVAAFHHEGIPIIKAFGVQSVDDLERAEDFGAVAVLLDAHAPGLYGGTGQIMDWELACDFMQIHPGIPIILAGGITCSNARDAVEKVRPSGLDVASGAEFSPGIKDRIKVRQILQQLERQ